jgi:hypothetical protein
MDRVPKSQSIDVQNPTTTRTWCGGKMCNMVGHMVEVESTYISHMRKFQSF